MSKSEPDFSIIVLFGRGQLEPCLGGLLEQTEENFEIIAVVGSEGQEAQDPRVKFLVIPDPNPAKRRNQAVAQSRGKYLAFIDDDATAPEDWLTKAKKILNEYSEIPGFSGSNTWQDKMDWSEQLVDMILRDKYFGTGSEAYQKGGEPHMARPGEAHLSNLLMRREIFNALGGFNEKIGFGGEDSEMIYLAKRKLGKNFWCFPENFVWHKRRHFGWEFLKRNIRFRRQNGRLIWLYPEMYLWNKSLWLAFALVAIFIGLLFIIRGWLALIIFAIYYLCHYWIHGIFYLKTKKWLFVIAPFIYFLHHLSYFLGLSAGLAEGLFRGRKRLRELLGREN